MGEHALALEALSHSLRIGGGNSKAVALRGYILARQGRASEAEDVILTLEAIARERYVPPYATALVRAGLGQIGRAVEQLQRAVDVHDVHLVLVVTDPKWDGLRERDDVAGIVRRGSIIREVP
jgi:Flp pilus assembly protein TadD